MKHSDYLKKKKIRETRKKIISVISAIVVFITTYALVLPAITLDVSKASQEPGIAYEQMQFKATAAAASVTAASTGEEAQVEEPAAEEPKEEPAEEIKEEPAEIPEEETSAVSAEEEKAEEVVEEAPAEPTKEETPAEEPPAEVKEEQKDKAEADSADAAPSTKSDSTDAKTADTDKAADQASVDQSGTDAADKADASAAATTAETVAEFKIPELDALDFDDILTGKTNFYYYHVENAEDAEEISSDSIDDWKKVGSDTVLAPEDFVRVYLAYEIPAGALNETNAVARYTLPAGLELSDKQIEAINKYENGIAASKSGSEHDKYLGAEAIEGSRTPDEKADDEYIAATVKVKKTDNGRQELVFTFIPYTVEKNQISYDEKGEVKSKGKEVKGFFTFDLTTSQIDFEETNTETVDKEDGTTEEIQYSEAKVVFADKDSNRIDRTLTLAGPVEAEEEETQAAEQKTLTSQGADYTVTVSYTDDAQIPDNAELAVREIEKDTDEYASYLEQAKGAVDNTKSVNEARFFDITILADGEKVEPQAPVNVQINFAGIEQTNTDDTQLLHYKDDEKIEVMDQAEFSKSEEQTVDTVQFETDGFSVYGIVGTETITTEHISHDGTKYEVTVTYGPEAKIPEGSWLRVTDIEAGTDEYDYARKSVLADKKEKGEFVDITDFNLAALDISIIDPDGNEIEPEATVQVDIKIKSLPEVEDLGEIKDSLEIQHHVEVADGVVIDKVFDGAVEGAYKMDTDEKIAAEGTVVDPSSVSDEDFAISEDIQEDVIDTSFETDEFSTFTVTWTYSYRRNVTVHYGYMDGNTFREFPTGTPSGVDINYHSNGNSGYSFLIYDIDGYEYQQAYYRTSTTTNPTSGSTAITPLLRYTNNGDWYYYNGSNYLANNSHIYMVYKPKTTPTTGGTPQLDDPDPDDWPQESSKKPHFGKSSTNNGDGVTNTVALTISAGEKTIQDSTKANVIVVFDVSGSMSNDLNGQTRLARAKTAVNNMADQLLRQMSGVKMALVPFSTAIDNDHLQAFTDNYSTFTSKVNQLSANGGTNWELALRTANQMAVDSDAATFIVFVTDGDPTYRLSRGNITDANLDNRTNSDYSRYRNADGYGYNLFGNGQTDPNSQNFNSAVTEASSIISHNKTFYAIGVSSDVTKVRTLVTNAGGSSSNAILASNSTELENAFKNITQSIKTTLGFGDVGLTDGITSLSSTEMKVMHEVDPESFTYYKVTSAGEEVWDPTSENCGLASYNKDTGVVSWNMGDDFQLEEGVTYKVTFRVWPSQDAYDLIAKLNNGEKVYAEGQSNSITPEERAQVQEIKAPTETAQGEYTLKTNTENVSATYKLTSTTGETVSVVGDSIPLNVEYGAMENMPLESMKLTIKKEFEDDLTAGEDREHEVTLVMKRRAGHQATASDDAFVDYPVVQSDGTLSADIVLNDTNNWTYSVYVAPGLEVDGEVLEDGYDFTVTEPGIDYHYGLIEEIINPMVVNGQDKYYGDGYLIDDESTVQEYIDQSITAVNRVKSGIDISKHVYDTDGTTEIYPDTEFTITGKLLGPDGQPYTWQDGDDENASGAYHKYDKDGNRIVYKGHFADSSNISFTLKAGERIRFINVPDGCTFEFTESTTGMDALGYEWMSTSAVTQHRVSAGGEYTQEGDVQPDVSGQTASLKDGKSVVGNKQYSITYGNKRTIALPDVELVKVDADDNTKKLNGAEFTLYSDAELTEPVTADGNGNEIDIVTGNKDGSTGPDGWYHIGLLPARTYYLVETSEPTGYVLDETPIVITVTKGTNSYTVTATKDGTSVISGPTDGVYTITVSNERATKYVKVFKYETGSNPEKALQDAQFTLTGPEGTDISYTGLTTNTDGYLVFGDNTYVELPVNDAAYTLTETKAPAGYNMMTENVVFTVTSGGVTGTGSGYTVVSGTEEIDGSSVAVYTIKVQNSAGVELPHTGGSGTLPYTLGGIALLMASALMYGFRMRRRERRLN